MRTLIFNSSKALGDSVAWMPYAEEYRQIYQNEVYYSTGNKELFEKVYPNIKFVDIDPDRPVFTDKAHTIYRFSYGADFDNHLVPMQYQAARQLHIPFRELRPRIYVDKRPTPKVSGRYACLAMQSTAQLKYWSREGGWQAVIDYLASKGIKSVVIDRNASVGKGKWLEENSIKKLNNIYAFCDPKIPLSDRVSDLMGADIFIGLGSGLSWLAWALYVPVVMIAGFSKPYYEFQSENYRVHNPSVCNGCFNIVRMNPRVWDWCPMDYKRQDFECQKSITPEMVIKQIDNALKSDFSKPASRTDWYMKNVEEWVEPDEITPRPFEYSFQPPEPPKDAEG